MKLRGGLPLLFLFITFMFLNLFFGSVKISFIEILKIFLGLSNNDLEKMIILDIRLPRVVSSMVVGLGLA
ncbi:MAG TPA: iron ABC transporter permease, partial [Thermotoga sp.]|nr:iron ABC transporter permease [Thermotoga sp.]